MDAALRVTRDWATPQTEAADKGLLLRDTTLDVAAFDAAIGHRAWFGRLAEFREAPGRVGRGAVD
jgi:hypothetical protein